MARVLFICAHNLCRSPLAHALFAHLAPRAGLEVLVDSAGTSSHYVGEPPHVGARQVLARHNIAFEHVARQISKDDLGRFDLIVAMDERNRRDIRFLFAAAHVPVVWLPITRRTSARRTCPIPTSAAIETARSRSCARESGGWWRGCKAKRRSWDNVRAASTWTKSLPLLLSVRCCYSQRMSSR